MESKSYATVGVGTPEERNIEIKDFLELSFKDSRTATVLELADEEGYLLMIQNDPNTGRNPRQEMWLSEASFACLLFSATTLLVSTGKDLNQIISELGNTVNFKSSVPFISGKIELPNDDMEDWISKNTLKDKDAIVIAAWDSKELVFLKTYMYPQQQNEAMIAFGEWQKSGYEYVMSTQGAFFERFIQPVHLKEQEEEE